MINNSLFTEIRDKGIDSFFLSSLNRDNYECLAFWQEQIKRCKYGYTVGGKFMPGKLYFYINFWHIRANEKGKDDGRKIVSLPLLRDIDWWIFENIEKAKNERKGICYVTGRGGGKSYTLAACAGHEYTFYPSNEIVISACDSKYSTDTMNKVKLGLDNLPYYLMHPRIKDDVKKTIQSGYKEDFEGAEVNRGFLCEIHNITFGDNPEAAVGKRPTLFGFDEAGKASNIKETFNASRECWMNGSVQFGMPFLTGTGGDMEKSTYGLAEMFYDPDTYNLLAFENKYDESGTGKICYFVPGQYCLNQFKDENGITDFAAATTYLEKEREIKKLGTNKDAYYKELQYRPFTPKEVFLITTGNIFDMARINDQIAKIKGNRELRNAITNGHLIWETNDNVINYNKVRFVPDPLGPVKILEHPAKDAKWNVYVGGLDPYSQNKANSSVSLGSMFIYKNYSSIYDTGRLPVAEYTGRPEMMETFNENVLKLAIYYNANILYENDTSEIYTYFKTKNKLGFLMDQPDEVLHQINKTKTQIDRKKGISMQVRVKNDGELKIKKYIEDCIQNIYFLDLLEEMAKYNDKGNFDRVMAFMLCLFAETSLELIASGSHEYIDFTIPTYKIINGRIVSSRHSVKLQ